LPIYATGLTLIAAGYFLNLDVIPNEGYNEFELLQLASSADIKSEHPIAKAIANKAQEQSIPTLDVTEFNSISGYGVVASNLEKRIFVGSPSRSNSNHVVSALKIDEYSLKKIKQNLAMSFAYNVITISIAAGLLYGFTHSLILTPTLAALGWIVSDSAVFGNSLLVRKFYSRN
jgi:cation transport ATPase